MFEVNVLPIIKETKVNSFMTEIECNRFFQSDEWRNIRTRILERDNCICQYKDCTEHRKWHLTIHHVDGNPFNNDDKNLVTLCRRHHRKFHSSAKWIKRKKVILSS